MTPGRRVDPDRACERTSALVSLALDAQLSDVGRKRLERHLARCAACRGHAHEIEGVTELLRRQPLQPFRCRIERRTTGWARRAPARRWSRTVVMAVAVAAAVVSLPTATTSGPRSERWGADSRYEPVPRMPLGQRSALDDFVESS